MREAWQRFRKDKAALFGAVVIAVVVTAALLAPWITPGRAGQGLLMRRTLPVHRRALPGAMQRYHDRQTQAGLSAGHLRGEKRHDAKSGRCGRSPLWRVRSG